MSSLLDSDSSLRHVPPTMYAVIQTGGKQYRVQPGDVVQVEKLEGEIGAPMNFDQVLFLSKPGTESSEVTLGKPLVKGAMVQGEIVGQGRGDKILIIKMKRRKQYRRTQGHRQDYTQILVTGVDNGSGAKLTLSDEDKALRMTKFQSHLKPKGLAFTPANRISRKKPFLAAEAKTETPAVEVKKTTKKKTTKTTKAKSE